MHIRWQRNRDILYSPGSVVKMHLHVSWNMYVERVMGFLTRVEWWFELEKLWPHRVRYVRKIYKWGFPTKRRSLAVDRQRGARYFIVSSLLAIPSPLCTRIWLSSPSPNRYGRRKGNDVEFSIHCERNRPTPPLRWKFSRRKKNYLKVGETWHLRLKKKRKENPSAPFKASS